MGVLPPGLVLPPYAREDIAWTGFVNHDTQNALTDIVYHPLHGYIDIIIACTMAIITAGAAGPRELELVYTNVDGFPYALAIPGATFDTGFTFTISFGLGLSSVASSGLHDYIAPLPTVTLEPNAEFRILLNGAKAADTYSFASMTIIHVPTGPPIEQEQPQRNLIPTTLLH